MTPPPVRKPTTCARTRSEVVTKPASKTVETMTTAVDSSSSRYFFSPVWLGSQGQLHLLEFDADLRDERENAAAKTQQQHHDHEGKREKEDFAEGHVFVSFFRQLAGQEGLEPTTNGFGDRYSTN